MADFKPLGIVVHAMGQYIEWEDELMHAPDFLKEIGLGANGYIEPNGTLIHGWKKGSYTPHAGISFHKEKGVGDLNNKYIGYELLIPNAQNIGKLYDAMKNRYPCYTTEQYLTLAKECAKDMKRYNFDSDCIVGHDEVSGDDMRGKGKGKRDPGPMFDWEMFFGHLKNEINKLK